MLLDLPRDRVFCAGGLNSLSCLLVLFFGLLIRVTSISPSREPSPIFQAVNVSADDYQAEGLNCPN